VLLNCFGLGYRRFAWVSTFLFEWLRLRLSVVLLKYIDVVLCFVRAHKVLSVMSGFFLPACLSRWMCCLFVIFCGLLICEIVGFALFLDKTFTAIPGLIQNAHIRPI